MDVLCRPHSGWPGEDSEGGNVFTLCNARCSRIRSRATGFVGLAEQINALYMFALRKPGLQFNNRKYVLLYDSEILYVGHYF